MAGLFRGVVRGQERQRVVSFSFCTSQKDYIYIICESPVFKRLVFQVSLYDFAYFTYIAYEIEGQAGLSIDL